MPDSPSLPCPCDSGAVYSQCCQGIIAGETRAATAEQLMRSRYTAHALGAVDYLLDSWAPETRAAVDRGQVATWARESQWLGLEVLGCRKGLAGDSEGWVEFCAHYRQGKQVRQHRELSYFRCEGGRWFFVHGQPVETAVKVGRNQVCPCGSGKKYKRCCGA